MEKNEFWDFLYRNKGKIAGVLIGLGVSLSILVFGFWQTLFVGVCVGIGLYFGGQRERRERFFENVSNLFSKRKDY